MSAGATTRDEARAAIIEVGRRLYARGLLCAAEGNISVRLGPDEVLATASGVHKGFLTHEQVVPVTLDGAPLASGPGVSTEIGMHLAAYRVRPDVQAVVHAHPPVATAFAVAGIPLAQCVMPEIVMTLGGVPIAPYGTPGTDEVAAGLVDLYREGSAFLLANHGAVTLGPTLERAFDLMETLEHFAHILFHARMLGNVNVLTTEHVAALLEKRKAAGEDDRVFPCDVCGHCPVPPTVALKGGTTAVPGTSTPSDAALAAAVAAAIQETLGSS